MSGRVIIETTDLRKTYVMGETEVHALRGVSIEIREGEMVAITGPSGSGKSTLMAILGALDQPSSGSYKLDGYEIGEMRGDDLAMIRSWRIGFVFQQFNLLSRSSALVNVALPLVYAGVPTKERLERAREKLELVGLGNRLDHKPTELSGGQQQRVAVARALANNPSLILADEPTGNLDSKTGEEIMALFWQLHEEQGVTLVIVTHDPEIAAQTERVIFLRDGEVVSDDYNGAQVRQQVRVAQTQAAAAFDGNGPLPVEAAAAPPNHNHRGAGSHEDAVSLLAQSSAEEVSRHMQPDEAADLAAEEEADHDSAD